MITGSMSQWCLLVRRKRKGDNEEKEVKNKRFSLKSPFSAFQGL